MRVEQRDLGIGRIIFLQFGDALEKLEPFAS
jgi:hypothetical protein